MLTKLEYDLLKILNNSWEKPIQRSTLCTMLGINDVKLRQSIRNLRLSGINICSNNKTNGYFLSKQDSMQLRTIQELEQKINGLKRTVYALKNTGCPPVNNPEYVKYLMKKYEERNEEC